MLTSNGTYCLVTEDNGYLTTLYAYSKIITEFTNILFRSII